MPPAPPSLPPLLPGSSIVRSDGTETRPHCTFLSGTCVWNAATRVECAKALCTASGFGEGEYKDGDDICTTNAPGGSGTFQWMAVVIPRPTRIQRAGFRLGGEVVAICSTFPPSPPSPPAPPALPNEFVTSDGSESRPLCTWMLGNTCVWDATTQSLCADALCRAANFSTGRFISGSDICSTSAPRIPGTIFATPVIPAEKARRPPLEGTNANILLASVTQAECFHIAPPPPPPPLPTIDGPDGEQPLDLAYIGTISAVCLLLCCAFILAGPFRSKGLAHTCDAWRMRRLMHSDLMAEALRHRRSKEAGVELSGKLGSEHAESTELAARLAAVLKDLGGVGSLPHFSASGTGLVIGSRSNAAVDDAEAATSEASSEHGLEGRFSGQLRQMVMGEAADAAKGIAHFMRVDEMALYRGMTRGVDAVVDEIEARGTAEDRECLDYVLRQVAGTSTIRFPNGYRDCDVDGHGGSVVRSDRKGRRLADFVAHEDAQTAGLSEAHVLALRLYTTAAFRSLNTPLRDRDCAAAHPFPVTIAFIEQGIKRLRAVHAMQQKRRSSRVESVDGASRHRSSKSTKSVKDERVVELWRGLRDIALDPDFEQNGGTELAPMSTTSSLEVAVKYSASSAARKGTPALLLRSLATSFMQRGADLSFLSAFPEEAEILFPPLTYLEVTGIHSVAAEGLAWTVVDIEPHLGT